MKVRGGDPPGLARPADRISRLLTNADLRTTLGRQARSWVEQEFSIPVMVAKMARVYDDAITATGV